MENIERLNKLGSMCITIGMIPTSYKISMTYEEQLLWFCDFLENKVIPAIDTNAEILQEVKEKVDNFDGRYNELEQKIEELRIFVNQTMTDLRNEVEVDLQKQYNEVITLMNNYQVIFTNQLNNAIDDLQRQIIEIELGNIVAYNPTNGKTENINKVLQDIYDSVRYDAITVNEFELLNLTATEFDNKNISAYSFDVNGKSILM